MSNQRVVLTGDQLGHLRELLMPDCADCLAIEHVLRMADEHPEGITEWRAFVGDEGESNDYADVRGSREEAVADLAIFTDQAAGDGAPYNRQGIESRQCGPWVEAALSPGDEQ